MSPTNCDTAHYRAGSVISFQQQQDPTSLYIHIPRICGSLCRGGWESRLLKSTVVAHIHSRRSLTVWRGCRARSKTMIARCREWAAILKHTVFWDGAGLRRQRLFWLFSSTESRLRYRLGVYLGLKEILTVCFNMVNWWVEITSPLTGGLVIRELPFCNSGGRNTGVTVTLLTDWKDSRHISTHTQRLLKIGDCVWAQKTGLNVLKYGKNHTN